MARDIDDEHSHDEVSTPDMDRITATIRRVQEQAAAFEADAANNREEDPIEATIRRVQAQAASQEPAVEAVEDDPIEATIRRVQAQAAAAEETAAETVEDDPIEATIRRVQAQATPQETALEAVEDDPIEAAIRRVQAQVEARGHEASHSDASGDDPTGAAVRPGSAEASQPRHEAETPESEPVEDPIEATIRRVQARAAQTAEARDEDAESDSGDDDPIEAAIRRVQAQAAHASDHDDVGDAVPSVLRTSDAVDEAIRVAEGGEFDAAQPVNAATDAADEGSRPEPTPWPGRDERLLGEAGTWEIAARRLEQGLQDAQRQVREMESRLRELERALGSNQPSTAAIPFSVVQPSPVVSDDDEWDDRPQVSAMQFGTLPGPPVYRDPSPLTATAAEYVEEPEPALPQPAARLRAIDADGNLDERIPRQYRITVEDKRRGVDLVPLHRAMQGLENVNDMSLLSYSNGVAMVLVESVGLLDPEILRLAVARVMSRETLVEVHNEQTMVLKIQE